MTQKNDPALAALGEWGFLDRLLPRLGRLGRGRFLVPPGDDAAVLKKGRAVLSIDGLTEGTHFRSAWAARARRIAGLPLGRALAWKLLGSCASDLAAMGDTTDRWAMIYLGAPGNVRLSFLDDLYRGTAEAAKAYGLALAGGDTVRAATLTLVAAVGARLRSRPLVRTGARPGDLLCVAGTVGDATAGLAALEGKARGVSSAEARYFAGRFFRSEPLFDAGALLARTAGVTAAMDVSDALSDCIDILCRASGVGAAVQIDRIPVSAAFARRFSRLQALAGGEDYALLFTARPAAARRLARGRGVTVIGRVTPDRSGVAYTFHGLPAKPPRAFEHFQ